MRVGLPETAIWNTMHCLSLYKNHALALNQNQCGTNAKGCTALYETTARHYMKQNTTQHQGTVNTLETIPVVPEHLKSGVLLSYILFVQETYSTYTIRSPQILTCDGRAPHYACAKQSYLIALLYSLFSIHLNSFISHWMENVCYNVKVCRMVRSWEAMLNIYRKEGI